MAKQVGAYRTIGTVEGICFYKREGEYLARAKSSLDRKRYLTDPAFEGSRRSNREMEKASPLASKLYKLMDPKKKGRPAFQELVGEIQLFIRAGVTEMKIEQWFKEEYLGEKPISRVKVKKKIRKNKIKRFSRLDLRLRAPKKVYRSSIKKRIKNRSPELLGVGSFPDGEEGLTEQPRNDRDKRINVAGLSLDV